MWWPEQLDMDGVAGWDPNGESGNHDVFSHAAGLHWKASIQSFSFLYRSWAQNRDLFCVPTLLPKCLREVDRVGRERTHDP